MSTLNRIAASFFGALLLVAQPALADGIDNPGSGGGGGSGTVTTLSVVTANGFAGTVANPTTTPAITLTTSVTGSVCSNGTALSACTTTGSGSTVLATSPTLVTPAIGVATATSLAIGGATIGTNALAVNGQVTNAGGTITTSQPFTITQTWNAAGVTFSGQTINITPTAFAATSRWLDLQDAGTSLARFTLVSGDYAQLALARSNALSTQSLTIDFAQSTATFNTAGVNGAYGFAIQGNRYLYFDPTGGQFTFGSGQRVGWGSTATGATEDTNLSRNASGVIQFGTTAANASGAWLAAKGTLTGGTLADQAQVLAITATQPASPTGAQNAIIWTITSAGSASQLNRGLRFIYAAGYTGGSPTNAISISNAAIGTASVLVNSSGISSSAGNIGIRSDSEGNGPGLNVGLNGNADAGVVNAGVVGQSQGPKNSATNIGVVGSAINTGTSPVQIGGFFSLNQTTVPTVSAALIADNGAQTDAIFLARDNGTTVFTIADGGAVTSTSSITAVSLSASGNIISTAGNIQASSAGFIYWGSRTELTSPADGRLLVTQGGGGGFDRLQFGGTTSSFPAIKRSTTILQARLADDSAYAPFEANTIRTATAYTVATLPAAGTAGRRAYVTDQLTTCAANGVALTGGGAAVCPVFDNGTIWTGG